MRPARTAIASARRSAPSPRRGTSPCRARTPSPTTASTKAGPAATRAVDGGRAEIDLADTGGAGTYGYPVGPGVGMPGGEHQPADQQPDVLPPQYPER